jgi:hypothetical protein
VTTIVEEIMGVTMMCFSGQTEFGIVRYEFLKVGNGKNMPKIWEHVHSKTSIS